MFRQQQAVRELRLDSDGNGFDWKISFEQQRGAKGRASLYAEGNLEFSGLLGRRFLFGHRWGFVLRLARNFRLWYDRRWYGGLLNFLEGLTLPPFIYDFIVHARLQ